MTQEERLLGKGLVFPIVLESGKPVNSAGSDLIQSNIRGIISFELGHRFFFREFGANTDNLLDEPNTEVLADLLQIQITTAISKYEKRIKNLSVLVVSNGDERLDIRITYDVKQTQNHDSFIYPFYKNIAA